MSLKIKRNVLERIVLEEFLSDIGRRLNEAPPGRGTVLDDEPEDEIPDPEAAPEEPLPTTSPAPEVGDEPEELPTGDEPADDDLEADLAGDEEGGAEPGTVAAELEEKTIESVSMEEDSKIMPGSTEVVITFRDSPDALRFLITKTGKVKIFYKGLHNDLNSPVEQIPGEEEPEEEMGGEEMPGEEVPVDAGEETEEMPPLGPEDMPPEEEEPTP
jgi:hypothetical protein